MELSVSIIVPICNHQYNIQRHVSQLVENVMDLTGRFEVLLMDLGSTDMTYEMATELADEYPQIRICRSTTHLNVADAIEHGIQMTSGEIIFVHDMADDVSSQAMCKLWAMRHDTELVMARANQGRSDASFVTPLAEGTTLGSIGGLQMIRREGLPYHHESIEPAFADVNRVTRTDLVRDMQRNPNPSPNLLSRLRDLSSSFTSSWESESVH